MFIMSCLNKTRYLMLFVNNNAKRFRASDHWTEWGTQYSGKAIRNPERTWKERQIWDESINRQLRHGDAP